MWGWDNTVGRAVPVMRYADAGLPSGEAAPSFGPVRRRTKIRANALDAMHVRLGALRAGVQAACAVLRVGGIVIE